MYLLLDGSGWLHQGQGHCIQMPKLHDTKRKRFYAKTSSRRIRNGSRPGKSWLISNGGAVRVYQGLFYAVQLYDVFEWRRFLGRLDCCSSGKEDEDYICF